LYNFYTHQLTWTTVTIGGWYQCSGTNTVSRVDAVTQSSGIDAVFAEGCFAGSGNGRLELYSQGAWTYIAGGGNLQLSFSAGLDTQGNAEVWFQVSENDGVTGFTFGSWTRAAGEHTYLNGNDIPAGVTLSATGAGECYYFQSGVDLSKGGPATLGVYGPQTDDSFLVALADNTQISAAGPADVYYIENGLLAEDTGGSIQTWKL
jgi:hypothetical protein